MTTKTLLRDRFYHEGRGPELRKVHYNSTGSGLKAADYFNPDDRHSPSDLKHLLFIGAQAFMFTPEEVCGHPRSVDWGKTEKAAIACLGKSEWFLSFDPHHLSRANHFQIMFFDEYLDIICETIEARDGGYAGGV